MKNKRPHLWVIRFIGLIVPARQRLDWRQQWEAELRHRELLLAEWGKLNWHSKLDLLRRSTAAFADALWLLPKRWEDEMIQDLRFGVRLLLKQPGVTAVMMIVLALGIGANTAIFSVVNALVFNPLPYRDPQQLMWVANEFRGSEIIGEDVFHTFQAQTQTFAHLAAFDAVAMTPPGGTERLHFVVATASLFPTLGVTPRLGRAFTAEEDRPGAPPVVVLSHEFWQRRFCGGGWLGLLSTAQIKEIGAVVPFYAPVNLKLPNRKTPMDVVSQIKVPVQGHYGTLDKGVPLEEVNKFADTLKTQKNKVEIYTCEAGYGFAAYNRDEACKPEAAKLAWERTVKFLRKHL